MTPIKPITITLDEHVWAVVIEGLHDAALHAADAGATRTAVDYTDARELIQGNVMAARDEAQTANGRKP